MGDYILRADVVHAVGGEERLLQLTDYDRDGAEDPGIVDAAIADAEGLINSYARKAFDVPFAPVPAIIKTVAKNLAAYCLRASRETITETVRVEQEDRIKWLEHLAQGKVDPGVSVAPTASGSNRGTNTARASSKAVSRENLKGFA